MAEAAPVKPTTPKKWGRGFDVRKQTGFTTIAMICFLMLYAPILTLVAYSFNAGTSVAIWEGFSWRWYESAWANVQVQDASIRSLTIAAVVSTVVATMAALATTFFFNFPGLTFIYAFINQPLMVPEIVTGVALLIFFAAIKVATGYTGLGYLLIAHTAFCIPFAYLPIRARLENMDLSLERAAADLYATPFKTFRHVTLPLLWPGILAGGMLAFALSFDEVIVTTFTAGQQSTLPIWMLEELIRPRQRPVTNVVAMVVVIVTFLPILAAYYLTRDTDQVAGSGK